MYRTLPGLLAVLVAVAAQETTAEPVRKERRLTEDAARARLEAKKKEVLVRVMPERVIKKGKLAEDKWLADFQTVQSEHYLLYTNGPTTTVKRFADSLENLYGFVKKQFPFGDIDHLLECYVFKDEEEYFRFCVQITGWTEQQARGTAGHATGAYYATCYQSPTADTVMHEATHQIVHACLEVAGVGSWFQEGMAVWVQKKVAGINPAAEARARVKGNDYYHLGELMEIPVLLSDPKGHGGRNYEQAGALIDFLVATRVPPVAGRFDAFLAAARKAPFVRDRKAAERLITGVYGVGVDELEVLWKQHLGLKPEKR